jgi:opacity protein-like surface antigen
VISDTLAYFKGGFAFTEIKNVGGDVNGGELTLSDAHNRDDVSKGTTFALGAEQFFTYKLVGRIEYSQTDFGAYFEANDDGAVPRSQFYRIDNSPIKTLSVGFIYQF